MTLLAATGWALWQQSARRTSVRERNGEDEEHEKPEDRNNVWKTWTENTIRVHIVALLLMNATHPL